MDSAPKIARSVPTPGAGGRGLLVIAAAIACLACPRVQAQDDVKNFKKPILVVETEGHHAPVRSLIWRNQFSLLSGGQDKVVKVWDFRDGARLARTIRPMIWRGPSGIIYTMALSPATDERGEAFLAVAGMGILGHGGDITVYRYPGRNREGTGEPVGKLFGPLAADVGHRNNVLCMAFDPAGKVLASGDADRTLILWDRDGDTFRPRPPIAAHAGAVKALAFTPDGTRLITAGGGAADGSVRAWDVATGAQLAIFPGTNPPAGVNSLAIHPVGQSAVIGREDGALYQLDLRNLALPPVRLATLPQQGPVEHVAFSPDGTKLAVSLVANRQAANLEPKNIACDVEIRDLPGGAVAHRHAGIPGLVYVTAFSPDGRKLAYAGGNSQAIFIRDVRNPQIPPTELKGQGTTIMTVGFTADSQTVGFSRDATPQAAGPAEGFDLKGRAYRPVELNDIRGPILQHGGWTLRSTLNPYRLQAIHADGRIVTFAVNQLREGNFWSYTIVPGNADRGHPRATVAAGTEAGVIVFDLETGRRVRMFAGHSGAVTALAPSPDGRWLASGSVDQTIRIYPLAGCDTLPGLGATFRQAADSSWVADKVEPRSFAASMGLLAGDRLLGGQFIDALINGQSARSEYARPAELANFVKRVDVAIPNDRIGILVRRNLWIPGIGYLDVDVPPFASSKRNNPALNLLVSLDKEWILWTPRGYYDTSIEGDSRLLGWQINPPFNPTTNQAPPRPTEFLPIATFANRLIRGEILDRVWNSDGLEADRPVVVVAPPPVPAPNQPPAPAPVVEPLPEKIVINEQPPRIEFTSLVPGMSLPALGTSWTLTDAHPRIKVQISAAEGSKVKDRQVVIDDRLVSTGLVAPTATVGEEFALDLTPNHPVRVSVNATNTTDNPRTAWVDVVYVPPVQAPPPPPPVRTPKLVMIGIGIDEFQNPSLPKLEFASNDAQRLSEFLPQHLMTPSGTLAGQGSAQDRIVLIGSAASAKGINDTFDQLRDQVQKKQILAGDMVAIFLDSHVLEFGGADGKKTTVVAPADLGTGSPSTAPSVTTRDLSERLGELANAGCRVILFLDGVHLPTSGKGTLKSNIKPWVRELQKDRRVITFVASKNGPSRLSENQRQGLFALGLLQAFRGAQSTGTISIEAFKTAVVEEVRNLSNRYQEVGLFLPSSVPPRTQFAKP